MNTKSLYTLSIILFFSFLWSGCSDNEKDNSLSQTEQKVESILKTMSLEEKLGQMTNIGLTALCKGDFWTGTDSLELDTFKMNELLYKHGVGSVQNKGQYPPSKEEWNRITKAIQNYNLKENKIPILFGIDAVHGAHYTLGSTMYPQQLALAATWNPEVVKSMAEICAYELRASNLLWNYAPCLDIATEPLWGRFSETFGEDPFLTSELGKAFVEGQQGNDLSAGGSVAVCLKHFIGYGSPQDGKDRGNAIIPENYIRQYYIPPFKVAIEAGAKSIMLNSGSVNGVPGHANQYYVNKILREELNFDGVIISDWADVEKLVNVHLVAENKKEATLMAVEAGLDICMVPYDASFATDLNELINEGLITEDRIDESVRRILKLKHELGLFDDQEEFDYSKFAGEEFIDKNYGAALESIILLKNDNNTLPLNRNEKILICGPSANSQNVINGSWSRSWTGTDTRFNDPSKKTILDALKDDFSESNVRYIPGASFDEVIDLSGIAKASKWADKIILCIGEEPATEKPSDIDDLNISDAQIKLAKELSKSGKDIITVMVLARPRIVSEIEKLSQSILLTNQPGDEGGRAISSVITGKYNPGGKLPYSYPLHTGATLTYFHKQCDEVDKNFGIDGYNPQWKFGHGLSYTTFESKILSISDDTISGDSNIDVMMSVTNTGDEKGSEVIQLYVKDLIATLSPDVMKLVNFKKVFLMPGETAEINLTIKNEDLFFINQNNENIIESGKFKILMGGDPNNLDEKEFYYTKN